MNGLLDIPVSLLDKKKDSEKTEIFRDSTLPDVPKHTSRGKQGADVWSRRIRGNKPIPEKSRQAKG